ncbi:MAG: ribbon-helix-helix domain-containing protein [Candidatus Woesearchaeota archaeon]
MAGQINVRLSDKMHELVTLYCEEHGFSSVQDFIKETIREKLFEQPSKQEMHLVNALLAVSEQKNLYGSEKELFDKLKHV